MAGLRSKDEIARLVHKGLKGGGYYEVIPDPEFSDKSPAGVGLQAMIDVVSDGARLADKVRRRNEEIDRKAEQLRFAKVPGFFPTPNGLIDHMLLLADVRQGMDVMEPSAGKGDIADAVERIVGKGNMVLCEIDPRLCEILQLKGYGARLVEGDFLERFSLHNPCDGEGDVSAEMQQFDRVLMNPPFEKGADADHVRHAYKLLRPGGRLVAIVSTITGCKQNRRSREFAELLESTGAQVEEVSAGAFAGLDSFRRTGVACKLVVIDKPATAAPAMVRELEQPAAAPSPVEIEIPTGDAEGLGCVIATPPLAHNADAKFVCEGYELLPPGGQLMARVSVVADRRQNRYSRRLAELLGLHGETIEESTPNRSRVSCKLIRLRKPAAAPETAPIAPHESDESRSRAPAAADDHKPVNAERASNEVLSVPKAVIRHAGGNILVRYRPAGLEEIRGQAATVDGLRSFVKSPTSGAFIFAGPSGVGKTAAALAMANELGCEGDFGGLTEIPSGTQDGKAVDAVLRSLRLRPMTGSGWKVVIINEADRMTEQAEAMWLDGLEHLPAKSVVIFTTNNLSRMTRRLIRRCEVYQFDSTSETFRAEMARFIDVVWHQKTGRPLGTIPEGLGKFELGSDDYSIGLALQQIAPYVRIGEPLPASFAPPIIRGAYGHGKATPAAPKRSPIHSPANPRRRGMMLPPCHIGLSAGSAGNGQRRARSCGRPATAAGSTRPARGLA